MAGTLKHILEHDRLTHLWRSCVTLGCPSEKVAIRDLKVPLETPFLSLSKVCPKCGAKAEWMPDWSPHQPSHLMAKSSN